MTRGEVIRALIEAHDTKNGSEYEQVDPRDGEITRLRWTESHGPEGLGSGNWLEGGSLPGFSYREAWKPRRWGPWEEVRTRDEAESAEDGEMYKLMINNIGDGRFILAVVSKYSLPWVTSLVPVRRAR